MWAIMFGLVVICLCGLSWSFQSSIYHNRLVTGKVSKPRIQENIRKDKSALFEGQNIKEEHEPRRLWDMHRTAWVDFPEGCSRLGPSILSVGVAAVDTDIPITSWMPNGRLLSIARKNYLSRRDQLLEQFKGKWAVVSTSNQTATFDTEREAYDYANPLFDGVVDDYCVYCVGSEYQNLSYMDSIWYE